MDKLHRGSAGNYPPVIITVDCRKAQQSPLRDTLHTLIDDPIFDGAEPVLQRVTGILQAERQKRTVA